MGFRKEIPGLQSPFNVENIIADSQHQRGKTSYQDHGIKYSSKAEASVDLVVKGKQSLVSIPGLFKDRKSMQEQSYGPGVQLGFLRMKYSSKAEASVDLVVKGKQSLVSIPGLFKDRKSMQEQSYGPGVQLGLLRMNTLSAKELQKKETEIKKVCKFLSKLYKKFTAEIYLNVNREVIVAQFFRHIDSEVLAEVNTYLERICVHLLSLYVRTDNRSNDDDDDYPSDGQEMQNIAYFYKTIGSLENDKKPGSQYSIALLPNEEVSIEEKRLEDTSSYTPTTLRTENSKEDDTASKLVEDEVPSVPLKSNDKIKEDKKQDTTAKLVVDDDRREQNIDCTTTAKCAEDSGLHFHSDAEESEDLCLRSTTETTPDISLDDVTLDLTPDPSSNLDESIRQCFFEWLRGQDGVTSYYYMRNQITIHVKFGATATTSAIQNIINTKFRQLRHAYTILFSDPGVCLPCANPGDISLSERGKPVQTPSNKEISPGNEISCSFIVSDKHVERSATFSGKICGNGMTAGHIVPSEMTQTICVKFESQVIGSPILVIKNVNVPIRGTQETRTTLGDLLFFLLNDQDSVKNSVECDPFNRGSKETYNVVLHRGPIKENDEVMVILRDERVKFGRIARIDHNDATVSNTLYIVDEDNLALTADGDSGALIVLRPKRGDHSLKAIGVVTHLHCILKPEFQGTNCTELIQLNAENSTSLGTIAIRLYDVLVAVQQGAILGRPPEFRKIDLGQKSECIEFSGPQATGQQFDPKTFGI